jgi:hypothetical protein
VTGEPAIAVRPLPSPAELAAIRAALEDLGLLERPPPAFAPGRGRLAPGGP